ncbi:MAG: hypothetical protein ACP5QT_05970 [Brevinematia bacterium]
MKVSDIISQKVSFENLSNKRRNIKSDSSVISTLYSKTDAVAFQRNRNEITSIIDLQHEFNKNMTSLNGFIDMERKINEFQALADEKKDFERLSKELSAISHLVKFNGENVISYLDTNVKDETSLYTLKMNLSKEIENLKSIVAKERKTIARYLIANENREALVGFSPEKTVENILNLLKESNISGLHKLKNNSNKLLSS